MISKKILIVDDEPDIVTAMKFSLELQGYKIVTAYDGDEGIQKAEEELPDLIILDVLMPKMMGDDMASALRNNSATAKIPVLFLTNVPKQFISGIDKNISEPWALDTKGMMYLHKTCEEGELLAAIRKLIGTPL